MKEKTRILIIDDEQTNINILLEILEFEEEYLVRSALSGEEGLALMAEFQPDIVLLDVMMPGMDGYEVCQRIRNSGEHCRAGIVMLSGRAMQAEIERGLAVGADRYLSKPFGMDELLAALDSLKIGKCREPGKL